MKVVLELLQQSSNIKRVTVRHDIVIGRGSDCNLRVSAPQVSRRHCFLRIDGESVAITDLESCNGTWLDGQKTVPGKRYFLTDGMQLAIGPVRFIARISDQEEAATPPADAPKSAVADVEEPTVQATPEQSAAMAYSIEHAGDSAEQDEPTVDYEGSKADSAVIELDEIELIDDGGESAEVILLDEATDIIDRDIAVEAVQLVEAVEVIDEDIDSQELMIAEEVIDDDDDGGDELRDFLQDDD